MCEVNEGGGGKHRSRDTLDEQRKQRFQKTSERRMRTPTTNGYTFIKKSDRITSELNPLKKFRHIPADLHAVLEVGVGDEPRLVLVPEVLAGGRAGGT